jgi:DNA-binding transcriptional ArsR family regulator
MTTRITQEALAELVGSWRREDLNDNEMAARFLQLLASDASWARAFGHPLRGEILGLLARGGPASPARASEELEVSLGSLAYHFRILKELGIIEVDSEIARRGAIEHVYRLAR